VTDRPPPEEVPPLLTFDDEDWLSIHWSREALLQQLEWPYIDEEVVAVFDGLGRRVWLMRRGEDISLRRIDQAPDLDTLASLTQRYFTAWTRSAPPPFTADAHGYVQLVVENYVSTPQLRRKKKR
jgi:hypothetical protein